ncbi:MAG: hypothetical protein IT423_02670 [Pirellulaceae bacterium]|nr:hypothetical protein [Pirellulaceae bacterium]
MNNPAAEITNTKFVELLKTYWAWRRLWIATTVVFGGFGLIYVLFLKADMWTAAQGLIVRDEANGAVMRLGRFQSQTEMKAAQETILEMARNTQVLREALLEVGPSKSWMSFAKISENWPSQSEIADLADDAIGVRAPKGAEFGTTEVIYLDIKQPTRERAIELNRAVCEALDNRLRQVRLARADGVINELVRATTMAGEELKKATTQLQVIEREAGADLSDLRGLSEANGNGSTSRQLWETVKTELRQLQNQHALLMTDYATLRETQTDPERLLSAPPSILSAHPGLRKLREGLADAQLNSSQLRGRFTGSHPLVYVATTAEKEIKIQLQAELALALTTTGKDVENSQNRIDNLKKQQQQLEERLERLARIRADHENLNQEVRSRTHILQEADRQLADARASRDAALSTSLLTRIDEPVLGERPVGPGRTTILAGMTLAGLFFGLGIVFLLTPLDGQSPQNERWNERLGRRLSDRFPWLADQGPGGAPRRRRNDIDRRQADRAAADPSSGAGYSRRTDTRSTPAATTQVQLPQIESEDPSVAGRLDALLLSELASLAPTVATRTTISTGSTVSTGSIAPTNSVVPTTSAATPETPNTETSVPEAVELEVTTGQPEAALSVKKMLYKQVAKRRDDTLAMSAAELESALQNNSRESTKQSSKKMRGSASTVQPQTAAQPDATADSSQSFSTSNVVSTTHTSVTPTSTAPTSTSSATRASEPAGTADTTYRKPTDTKPTDTKPTDTKPTVPTATRPRLATRSSSAPDNQPPSMAPANPTVTPPANPTTNPVASQTIKASALPVKTLADKPGATIGAQPVAMPVPATQVQATQSPLAMPPAMPRESARVATEASDAKPVKPGLNMFRPNQAVEQNTATNRQAPQPVREVVVKSGNAAAAGSKASAIHPNLAALSEMSNSFDTPVEGGLAGIGLPTQKLPDSFASRQS